MRSSIEIKKVMNTRRIAGIVNEVTDSLRDLYATKTIYISPQFQKLFKTNHPFAANFLNLQLLTL